MKAKINWQADLWESIEERDVLELRNKLNDFQGQNEKKDDNRETNNNLSEDSLRLTSF